MSGYLLDTNVISELLRKQPEGRVIERVRATRQEQLATSVVCIMELRHGAARHPRGTMLWARITREVLPLIHMLPFGFEEAVRSGEILADLEGRGEPIGVEEVLIAASALEHGLTLVTRNVRHFSRIRGLAVESWWP